MSLLAAVATAQQGDKKGETQVDQFPLEKVPPAPALSPAEALETFTLPDGFRIELVAAEPLVDTPIAMTFDLAGRMYVVEMRGYMPNVDGKGEQDIPGRVVVLEDTDGDGQADRRTIFLDNLVMPRAIALAGDGVVVAEPPHLWFCRDLDGDLVCDEKTEIASDYGDQKNPEHTANGMVRALDNWYYNLYHTYRYRWHGGKWDRQPVPNRVQWGLSQDNYGRLFFTSNSDQLRGDLIPSHYAGSDPKVRLPGLNARIASDQTTWPSRINAGINRGYQQQMLREDGTLARFTAACGTLIYRGGLFPEAFDNNAFICEPSGNMIRRNLLVEKEGDVSARNAYDQSEFLTSSDERFRPVNLYNGPEGALYIVDMYHGVLQHKTYVTSYLRRHIEHRDLETPLHMGRIYRVVPEDRKLLDMPDFSRANADTLVEALAHPNGWVRDTAQRVLVDCAMREAIPAATSMARTHENPLARLHALWTLEGLNGLEADTVLHGLEDPHPRVRVAAVRLAEPFLRVLTETPAIKTMRSRFLAMREDPAPEVRRQLALSLGDIAFGPSIKNALTAFVASGEDETLRRLAGFSLALREPKQETNEAAKPKGRPLTEAETALFNQGKEVFQITCIACHQQHGLGQEGLAPPLVDSEWVSGSEERLARIVLHGVRGPITVNGEVYEIDMPALSVLDDEQIAGVLTYVRREWGHSFEPVKPELVKKVRAQTEDRIEAWTEAELLQIK